jgi:hypothetical protein
VIGAGLMESGRIHVLLLFLAVLWAAQAETWTNQAGRTIEAKLGAFDGAWVTLVRSNGSTLRLPLSALSAPDQRRVRMQKAQSIAPPFVRAACKDAVAVLDRFARLPADQQTAEGWSKAVRMACAIFDERLTPRSAELTSRYVQEEVQHLRDLLARAAPRDLPALRGLGSGSGLQ